MHISNIVYKIDEIFIQNIFLLENKRNIIMDGKFTKIIYSDNLFTTNGIFINVPFMLESFTPLKNSIRTGALHLPHSHGCVRVFDAAPSSRLLSPELRSSTKALTDSSFCLQNSVTPPRVVTIRTKDDFSSKLPGKLPVSEGSETPSIGEPSDFVSKRHANRATPIKSSAILARDILIPEQTLYWEDKNRSAEFVSNNEIIRELIRIEYCILEFYKRIFKCNKKITTILKNQLHNGCIKTYISEGQDMRSIGSTTTQSKVVSKSNFPINFPIKYNFVLKISGIWEDYSNIGITYKFMSSMSP